LEKDKEESRPKNAKVTFTGNVPVLIVVLFLIPVIAHSPTKKKMTKWGRLLQMLPPVKQWEEVICSQNGNWWLNKPDRSEKALMLLVLHRQIEDHLQGRRSSMEKDQMTARMVKRGAMQQHSELVKQQFHFHDLASVYFNN
jgi:hypothetical protein